MTAGPDIPADDGAQRRVVQVGTYRDGAFTETEDTVAVEAALEIHVAGAKPIVTMRTPGNDRELVAGLMHGEGVVESRDDIVYLDQAPGERDVIRLMLRPEARERLGRIERSTVATSACGVCGKPSFEPPVAPNETGTAPAISLSPVELTALPDQLRDAQSVFDVTGGLHAAALFNDRQELVFVREDVGRHNALDKLIGRALLAGEMPLLQCVVMLSGRASYELVQKSVAARVPIIAAISAPSSYAVDLAAAFDATLVGFLRGNRFNVYTGADRIQRRD